VIKTLCFGGSFNPIHVGHLICARAVAEKGGFDRVLLIPSAQPPHKPSAEMAEAEHRLHLCQLAAAEQRNLFGTCDVEMRRIGPSYTLDTARTLKAGGLEEVYWLIGGDTVPHLQHWHQPEDLMEEVRFIVMARPGWSLDWPSLPDPYRRLESAVVEAPLIDISATEIRRRIAAGLSIAYLTPPPVAAYIESHHLYRL